MSASTMTFLGVASGAAAPGTVADAPVTDSAGFTAVLAALAAAPAVDKAAPPVKLPVENAAEAAVLDGEAVAALLAGMLQGGAVQTPEATGEADADLDLQAMPAGDTEPALDAAAIVAGAGPLAGSAPIAEAEAAAAAAALAAAAAPALPPPAEGAATEAGYPPSGVRNPQSQVAAQGPAQSAGAQIELPAELLPQQEAALPAQTAAPVPAAQVANSPLANGLLAASGTVSRETGTGRVDAKTATQALRNLMQALAWSEAPGSDALSPAAMQAPAAAVAQDSALQSAQDMHALLAAHGQDAAAAAEVLAAAPPETLEQAAPPSPAALGLLHTTPGATSLASTTTGMEQAVRSAVGTPRWAEELGNQLVMMNARGQQEGSLTLTPEHLGPLEVRISVHHNTANVWFGAQHADTRAALNEAMPRLRELFNEAGLSLGNAGVSQEAPRQDRREAMQDFARLHGADAPAADHDLPATARQISRGLLDTYA